MLPLKDQAGPRSPAAVARLGADARPPDLVSLHVEGNNPRLAEERPHHLPIGDRRVARVTMLGEVARVGIIGAGRGDVALPGDLSVVAIDLHQVPGRPLSSAPFRPTGNEDRIAMDDRARRSSPRQRRLPEEVFGVAPLDRRRSAGCPTPWPAELRPILGRRGGRGNQQTGRGEARGNLITDLHLPDMHHGTFLNGPRSRHSTTRRTSLRL